MNPSLPFITIITPTYNASFVIAACIESVAQQHYPYLEHWIIDGASTDNTLEIIASYADKYPHLHYHSEKDKGIYDAMNKGIDKARDESWLLFLGADDILFPGCFDNLFDEIDFHKVDLIYGKAKKGDLIYGRPIDWHRLAEDFSGGINIHTYMYHAAILQRKEVFYKYGYYDISYSMSADNHFYIKLISNTRLQFTDRYIAECGSEGIGTKNIDQKLLDDSPALALKYLNIQIDMKKYNRNKARAYISPLYRQPFKIKLLKLLKLMWETGDYAFFIKSLFVFLLRRVKD
jgi:glycosyltransferase involved in cell wall biosynthesis